MTQSKKEDDDDVIDNSPWLDLTSGFGVWSFLIVWLLLAYKCSGITLW